VPFVRVLVTGGAGFIGSHIVDALVADGHQVAVVDDLSSGRRSNLNPSAEFYEVDIVDAAKLGAVFAEVKPEVVTHQAAQTSVAVSTREPARDAQVNVVGSIHVLEHAVAHGTGRVVFASTGGAIYGEVEAPRLAKVGEPTHPLSPYACSKLAVEHYLRMYGQAHGLPTTVLRYANVYGPRQDPHGEAGVVAIFAQRMLRGDVCRINARKEVGDDGCIRDYVFVDDVVRANRLAIAGTLGNTTVNVCTGIATTTRQIAEGLLSALGLDATLDHGPWRPGDLERSVLDPAAMIESIGAAMDLTEGLRRTAHWFRDAGAAG
jgi:UDP-glucose 4-epimerase